MIGAQHAPADLVALSQERLSPYHVAAIQEQLADIAHVRGHFTVLVAKELAAHGERRNSSNVLTNSLLAASARAKGYGLLSGVP